MSSSFLKDVKFKAFFTFIEVTGMRSFPIKSSLDNQSLSQSSMVITLETSSYLKWKASFQTGFFFFFKIEKSGNYL